MTSENIGKAELSQAMTTSVDLNILLKFINRFDGSREKLNAFITNCQNAVSLASPAQQGVLLKYVLSQLEGPAESACVVREFESFKQLEDYLKSQFGEKKHYAALLSDLQDCRQSNNETVTQFSLRIESCLSKLLKEINISIPTKKKGELAGRLAAMQDLATHTFITGLNPRLSQVVRCRDPETLNEAINYAVSEEKIHHATMRKTNFTPNHQARNNNYNNNNQGRFPQNQNHYPQNQGRFPQNQGRFPQNQGRFSHQQGRFPQNQGRFPQNQGHSNAGPHNHQIHNTQGSSQPKPEVNQSRANYDSQSAPLVCRYCKFYGHTIESCRKRQYANRFNNSAGRNQPIHAVEESEYNDVSSDPAEPLNE